MLVWYVKEGQRTYPFDDEVLVQGGEGEITERGGEEGQS
jgi:hypothetical protein